MKIVPIRQKAKSRKQGRGRKGDGSLKLRGRIWWYIIPDPQHPGKRIEKSCETENRDEAMKVKHKAMVAAHSPRALAVPTTVGEILDGYETYFEKECPRSVRSLRSAVKQLRKGFAHLIADELSTADTDQYRDDRTSAGVVDASVNRELGYFKAALRQAMKFTPVAGQKPQVTKIPYMRMPSEKDNVREGFIDREDYLHILPHLDNAIKAIFVCAFHTGARSGELKMIQWSQVNFEQSIIELRPKTTKNSDGRWIPIWGDMRKFLLRQKELRDATLPDCPWVFFWPKGYAAKAMPGERLKDFRYAWNEAMTEAGHPNLLFHDLRRSAIKYADQEAKISPHLVRLMSGHKTDAVYTRYNIAGGRDMSRIAEALDTHLQGKVVELKRRHRA